MGEYFKVWAKLVNQTLANCECEGNEICFTVNKNQGKIFFTFMMEIEINNIVMSTFISVKQFLFEKYCFTLLNAFDG